MDELRVADGGWFACDCCSVPRTSFSETFGPVEAPRQGDLGAGKPFAVVRAEGDAGAEDCVPCCSCCCCFLRSRCDNLPVNAPLSLSSLVCDRARDIFEG